MNVFRIIPILWAKRARASLVVFFGATSSFLEAISLVLLIPVLNIAMNKQVNDGSDLGDITNFFVFIYSWLGVEMNFLNSVIGLGGAGLISSLILYAQQRFIIEFNFRYELEISKSILRGIFNSSWICLSSLKRGDLTNTLVREVNFARSVVLQALNIISSSIRLLVFSLFSLAISMELTLSVAVIGAIISLFTAFFAKKARQLGDITKHKRAKVMTDYITVFENFKFIKLLSIEKNNFDLVYDSTKGAIESTIDVEAQKCVVRNTNKSLVFVFLLITIYFGFGIMDLNFSQILVMIFLFSRINPEVISILNTVNWINSMMISIETVEDLNQKLLENKEETQINSEIFLKKDIEFRNVSFGYNSTLILEDVSFRIKKGEYIVLLGETGSGKTTLLDLLLLLFYPTSGKIFFDSKPTTEISRKAWGKCISYIGPENYLITESIEKNLLIGHTAENIPKERADFNREKICWTKGAG